MLTISKESLILFATYMDDEIPVEKVEQFIKNKVRDRQKEILILMNLQPLQLLESK